MRLKLSSCGLRGASNRYRTVEAPSTIFLKSPPVAPLRMTSSILACSRVGLGSWNTARYLVMVVAFKMMNEWNRDSSGFGMAAPLSPPVAPLLRFARPVHGVPVGYFFGGVGQKIHSTVEELLALTFAVYGGEPEVVSWK